MNKDTENIARKVRHALADYLGVEPDDIEDDDVLMEDLHMKPTDLTDFAMSLSELGFETDSLDFTQIETFSDLIETLSEEQ